MTDDNIKQKALALLNEVRKERGGVSRMMIYRETNIEDEALYRAIEQHEAYKQKVSDAVEAYFQQPDYLGKFNDTLGRFIIPKPKPDPLVEILDKATDGGTTLQGLADRIRTLLEARGLEIREKGQ